MLQHWTLNKQDGKQLLSFVVVVFSLYLLHQKLSSYYGKKKKHGFHFAFLFADSRRIYNFYTLCTNPFIHISISILVDLNTFRFGLL